MLSSASVSQAPLKPTLEEFDEVLELLARELHDDSDPERDAWIRGSFSAAGVKLSALEFVLRHSSRHSSPALLDIGAQIGSLTMYAARFGIRSSAVDLPYFFEKFASASLKSGIDYRSCDVSTDPLPFADESFDYVTYLDVIEHHPHSPKRVLEEIHRVLKPRGWIIISTPNQASIYNRLTLLTGGSISDPFNYFFETAARMTPYPGHHREYVRAELRSALVASGFRVLECHVIDDDVRPALSLAKRGSNANALQMLWRHKMSIGPAALGHVWSFLGLPFGRVLWAVGEKAKPKA
jgi:2-polyprenyl-3-methyl-5-hydroxy-6-metoxy-1,4-benzoquinol methylase